MVIAAFGDDYSTPEKDGLSSGETIVFKATTQNGLSYALYPSNSLNYVTNGIATIPEFTYEDMSIYEISCDLVNYNWGCTDSTACNYNPNSNVENNSCEYSLEYYNCAGMCVFDTDSDGVCDELEIVGCQEIIFTNYDSLATDSGPCDISWYEYQQIVELQMYNIMIEYDEIMSEYEEYIDVLNIQVDSLSYPIMIDLLTGWNMIGYTQKEPQDVVATLQEINDIVIIVKNNQSEVYWPEFGFNGIGEFIPGQGYQIKVFEAYSGFTYPDVGGQRIELTPHIPQWAIDMEVQIHPNDIRTLVRVVNMLGQEVNPENQPTGTVLLYLYNDATVEKKIK
jgi:hypothetical protein